MGSDEQQSTRLLTRKCVVLPALVTAGKSWIQYACDCASWDDEGLCPRLLATLNASLSTASTTSRQVMGNSYFWLYLMERNRQSEESHVSASPVKPISKHIKSKKAYNKSNEAWENKTDTNPIKVVFSFFVSFFPLDIVTRRSGTRQQENKQVE